MVPGVESRTFSSMVHSVNGVPLVVATPGNDSERSGFHPYTASCSS